MWYHWRMRRIRITMEEALLKQLDSRPEVRAQGRSSVICEAVRVWLREKETLSIDARHRAGYRIEPKIEEELAGWTDEGVWPEAEPAGRVEGTAVAAAPIFPTSTGRSSA